MAGEEGDDCGGGGGGGGRGVGEDGDGGGGEAPGGGGWGDEGEGGEGGGGEGGEAGAADYGDGDGVWWGVSGVLGVEGGGGYAPVYVVGRSSILRVGFVETEIGRWGLMRLVGWSAFNAGSVMWSIL